MALSALAVVSSQQIPDLIIGDVPSKDFMPGIPRYQPGRERRLRHAQSVATTHFMNDEVCNGLGAVSAGIRTKLRLPFDLNEASPPPFGEWGGG